MARRADQSQRYRLMNDISVAHIESAVRLYKVASWRGVRVLAWERGVLYAGRGYEIVRLKIPSKDAALRTPEVQWQPMALCRPVWWRNLTSRNRLTYRLVRDGFHALAILRATGDARKADDDPALIAAIPGAIVTKIAGSDEFRVTHRVQHGTRPLHITVVPNGTVYWGEYFGNRERAEVHIYASADRGESWQVAYTFPAGAIRHVHNIVFDSYGDCLWILTGDEGAECKILRASPDLHSIETVVSGNQQARAAAAIPMPDGLYFSTDTPFERNHLLRLDRRGNLQRLAEISSSSIFGCRVGEALFFSTMVEPSTANYTCEVQLVGSSDRKDWQVLARWRRDKWPEHYFQYGNAFLPGGHNATNYLAATTIAVEHEDLVTSLWEVESSAAALPQRLPTP